MIIDVYMATIQSDNGAMFCQSRLSPMHALIFEEYVTICNKATSVSVSMPTV